MGLFEFKGSLVYIGSSKSVGTTGKPCLKETKKIKYKTNLSHGTSEVVSYIKMKLSISVPSSGYQKLTEWTNGQ